MCPPFRSCAAPPPGLRSAPPRLARARLLRSPLALVPRSVYPLACVRPSPLQAPLLWARRETREGLGYHAEGAGLGAPTLLSPGVRGRGGVRKSRRRGRRGWTRRPSPLRARAAGLAWPAPRRTGLCALSLPLRAWVGLDTPSVLLRTRAGRGGGWAGVTRAEGVAHRPSSCYAGGAGRGAWGWAGIACAEGDWGGHAVLRARVGRGRGDVERWGVPPFRTYRVARPRGKGRGRGDVPSCTPFPCERGGVDRGAATCPPSAQTRRMLEGREGGRRARANVVGWSDTGKGPPTPHLRANGAGGGQCGGKEGAGATYPRVPPFHANRAARTGGGSRELPLCARTGRRAASTFRREWGRRGEGSGRRGEEERRGVDEGVGVLCSHTQFCTNWHATGISGKGPFTVQFWTLWRKRGVPATYANVAGTFCFCL
ncbi:hypothetical protein EDB85DRAFT_1897358 [Lactarius pseudohatsudake]|nr:hypothetical protein EDB85DRAFT_1897358 [Lactarius pseudohatsudake]